MLEHSTTERLHRKRAREPGDRTVQDVAMRRSTLFVGACMAISIGIPVQGAAFLGSSPSRPNQLFGNPCKYAIARKSYSGSASPPRLEALLDTRSPQDNISTCRDKRSLESDLVAQIRQCRDLENVQIALCSPQPKQLTIQNDMDLSSSGDARQEIIPTSVTPNVAAAALRKITRFTVRRKHHGAPTQLTDFLKNENKNTQLIPALLERISEVSRFSDEDADNLFTVYALSDTLSSLAALFHQQRPHHRHNSKADVVAISTAPAQSAKELVQSSSTRAFVGIYQEVTHQMIASIAKRIDRYCSHLHPKALVDSLRALDILGQTLTTTNSTQQLLTIQDSLCRALTQGHVLARLTAGEMSIALSTLSNQPSAATAMTPAEGALSKALMRRFRKQKVRQSAQLQHLCRAAAAASRIICSDDAIGEEEKTDVRKEAKVMVYTVLKTALENIQPQQENKQRVDSASPLLRQMKDLISAAAVIGVLNNNADSQEALGDDPVALQLWNYTDMLVSNSSSTDLAYFLGSLERIGYAHIIPHETMLRVGEQFRNEVEHVLQLGDDNDIRAPLSLQTINTILRVSNLKCVSNATLMDPFLDGALRLFQDDHYLSQCSVGHLISSLWFLERLRFVASSKSNLDVDQYENYHAALVAVGDQILNLDVESYTPSQASSILSSYTSIASLAGSSEEDKFNTINDGNVVNRMDEQSQQIILLLSDLFHDLGGVFLTSSPKELRSKDVSAALYAYAKASYVQDMGIFDHLSSLLATRVDDCTVRQVAQSLWACGKMAVWEDENETNDDTDFNPPPYLPDAITFAKHLSSNSEQLTTKDVAQALWAMGRLSAWEDDSDGTALLNSFVHRAAELAPELKSQEIANILWGLSRLEYQDGSKFLHIFADEILSRPDEKPKPQEAANILYALARMGFCNDALFSKLSLDMLDQMESASAQAIANTLWAFQAVHLSPPRELLDSWAIHKLGLIAVTTRSKNNKRA